LLAPHYHSLFVDGVFVADSATAAPRFHPLPSPTNDDLLDIVQRVARRVRALVPALGGEVDDDSEDDLAEREPLLARCAAASITGRSALDSAYAPRRARTTPPPALQPPRLCVMAQGYSLHAAVRVGARAVRKRERLCAYIARPPISNRLLHLRDDGDLAYDLKRPWSDGSTQAIMSPLDLIARLVALVAPPFKNLLRYHGVLAPGSAHRDAVAKEPPRARPQRDAKDCPLAIRSSWARLLKRVFEDDVTLCPRCGGPMRMLGAVLDREAIRRILLARGLPFDPPRLAPARPPEQPELPFDDGTDPP
jgi:hypothetical protein